LLKEKFGHSIVKLERGQGVFGPERAAGHMKTVSDEWSLRPSLSFRAQCISTQEFRWKSFFCGLGHGLFYSTSGLKETSPNSKGWALSTLLAGLGTPNPSWVAKPARMNSKSLGPFTPHAAKIPNQCRPKFEETLKWKIRLSARDSCSSLVEDVDLGLGVVLDLRDGKRVSIPGLNPGVLFPPLDKNKGKAMALERN
jgi:hypothetical protein